MDSGIYIIKNNINNKVYIGQSIRIKQRIANHKCLLKKGNHANDYLQKQVNKYGLENFDFTILEYIPIEKLDEREKYWIDTLQTMDRSKGYNLESGGNEGKIVSEETRLLKVGKNNPMYGRKQSKEFVEFIRKHNRGSSDKLTKEDVEKIKVSLLQEISQLELADKFGVDHTTISKIATCRNWEWVREDLNEKLLEMPKIKKAQRDKQILKLFKEKMPMYKIAKIVNCDIETVSRVLKNNNVLLKKDIVKIRNEKIIKDYFNGLSKKEISIKYDVTLKTCNRVIFNYKKSQADTEVN